MSDFDYAGRYGVKRAPAETRYWMFPNLPNTLMYSGWLDSQSAPRPGEADRRCDTIMGLSNEKGVPWAAIIELYTRPDSKALARGGEYLWRFWGELRHGPHDEDKYQMALALVFLTTAPSDLSANWTLPCVPPVTTGLMPRPVIMSAVDALAHLQMIRENRLLVWLLIWLPLMKGGQTKEAAKAWRELADKDHRIEEMADLTLTFARLTDCEEIYMAELNDITLTVSPFMEEARRQGYVKLQRANTVVILNKRFPGQVPPALVERINAEKDLDILNRWFEHAIIASLDQFQRDM